MTRKGSGKPYKKKSKYVEHFPISNKNIFLNGFLQCPLLQLCCDGSWFQRNPELLYSHKISGISNEMNKKHKNVKLQVKGGSAAMEPMAAKTCLLSLLSYDLTISSFTTDRSSTIDTMMKADPRLSGIRHEYDIWHWNSQEICSRVF